MEKCYKKLLQIRRQISFLKLQFVKITLIVLSKSTRAFSFSHTQKYKIVEKKRKKIKTDIVKNVQKRNENNQQDVKSNNVKTVETEVKQL